MPRECPVCGARSAALEARFCRRCGAPLKAADAATTNTVVSPVAPTTPLTDEGRATSGLVAEESQRLHDHTSRIKRAEMEELLRRVAREHDGEAAGPPPLTSADEPVAPVAASTTAPASTAEPSPTTEPAATDAPETDGNNSSSNAPPVQLSPARGRVSRRVLALILSGLALVVITVAFIALRRSKASGTVGPTTPPPPAAEGAQPVAQAQEAGAQQIEPVAIASPPPAATPRPTPSVRARETETAAQTGPPTETQAPAVPGAAPAPEAGAPAVTGAATETTPTVSPTEHYQRGIQLWATDRRAALEEFRAAVPSVPDAYYYLGSEYYSDGRDVKSLSDGELRAALNYFTRATSGPHSGQATRYVQALGKEYDRRKKQPRR